MKLGPIHIIRNSTFVKLSGLHDLWKHFSQALSREAAQGNALADCVLDQAHGLMHSPLWWRSAPGIPPVEEMADPARSERATHRVIAAYQRALEEQGPPPTPSMWDVIAREKHAFLQAMAQGEHAQVHAALARMFNSNLTWGLGQFDPAQGAELVRSKEPTHLHLRLTDTLVNLAEALGVARTTSWQQDVASHLHPLNRDLDETYRGIIEALGFDPYFPAVGQAYGFRVLDRLVTIDSLTHAYSCHRLHQLGCGPDAGLLEIGGGYGCLAMLAHRAGFRRYTIVDLPWVNALQGYFLLCSLPEDAVQLLGEPSAPIRVLPYWHLDREPERSYEGVINADSLPEMGRATAAGYLPKIHRVARGFFLSINQEAMAHVPEVGAQNCVAELVAESGLFHTESRQRYWMRQGFVEELFRPIRT